MKWVAVEDANARCCACACIWWYVYFNFFICVLYICGGLTLLTFTVFLTIETRSANLQNNTDTSRQEYVSNAQTSLRIYAVTYTHQYTCAHAHIRTHRHTSTPALMYTHAHTCALIHTDIPAHVRICTHMRTHTSTSALVYTHAHARTWIQSHLRVVMVCSAKRRHGVTLQIMTVSELPPARRRVIGIHSHNRR